MNQRKKSIFIWIIILFFLYPAFSQGYDKPVIDNLNISIQNDLDYTNRIVNFNYNLIGSMSHEYHVDFKLYINNEPISADVIKKNVSGDCQKWLKPGTDKKVSVKLYELAELNSVNDDLKWKLIITEERKTNTTLAVFKGKIESFNVSKNLFFNLVSESLHDNSNDIGLTYSFHDEIKAENEKPVISIFKILSKDEYYCEDVKSLGLDAGFNFSIIEQVGGGTRVPYTAKFYLLDCVKGIRYVKEINGDTGQGQEWKDDIRKTIKTMLTKISNKPVN